MEVLSYEVFNIFIVQENLLFQKVNVTKNGWLPDCVLIHDPTLDIEYDYEPVCVAVCMVLVNPMLRGQNVPT